MPLDHDAGVAVERQIDGKADADRPTTDDNYVKHSRTAHTEALLRQVSAFPKQQSSETIFNIMYTLLIKIYRIWLCGQKYVYKCIQFLISVSIWAII